jgi:hypothetical protein
VADSKVTDLTAASTLDGTELIPIVQAATSKKATVDQVVTLLGGREGDSAAIVTPAAGFAADTYLVGSAVAIPNGKLKAGSKYRLQFHVTKTAAGLATPIVTLRIGTLGTVADSAKLVFTFAAGSAAIDTGIFELTITFNAVGSGTTAVVEGVCELRKNTITAAGLVATAVANITLTPAASAGFDSTVSGLIIGASYNGGASAVHTVRNVWARLDNLL